jgi:hypothetical protein
MQRLFGFEHVLTIAAFEKVRFKLGPRPFRQFLVKEQSDLMLIVFTIQIHTFDKCVLSF